MILILIWHICKWLIPLALIRSAVGSAKKKIGGLTNANPDMGSERASKRTEYKRPPPDDPDDDPSAFA